jgi:hypothetical protein
MTHDLTAERQIADLVSTDLQPELVGLGPGHRTAPRRQSFLGQSRQDALIGD